MDDLTGAQKAIQARLIAVMDPEQKKLLQQRKMLSKVSDNLSALRRQRDNILNSSTMSSAAKNKGLEEINRKMTELARRVVQQ